MVGDQLFVDMCVVGAKYLIKVVREAKKDTIWLKTDTYLQGRRHFKVKKDFQLILIEDPCTGRKLLKVKEEIEVPPEGFADYKAWLKQ
jgi:hypothetical protein